MLLKKFTQIVTAGILLINTIPASAFVYEGLNYQVNTDKPTTVSLTKGAVAYADTVVIPSKVYSGSNEFTVTRIGDNAFDLTTNLKCITFPATLEYIGTAAFFKTSALRSIYALGTTPADISTSPFATTVLTNATLYVPDGCWLKYQKEWVRFYNINEAGFFSASFNGMNYQIMSPTDKLARTKSANPKYSGDVTVPATIEVNGVTYQVAEIGAYTFDGCEELTSVTIPEGVKAVGAYAMRKTNKLTNVKFPSTVEFYNSGIFNASTGIKSVDMSGSATRVENVTFQNCTALESVILPQNTDYIGASCFSGCTKLATVQNSQNITVIMSGSFQNTPMLQMTLPPNLVMLENTSFSNSGVTLEEYPATLNYLEANVFKQCPNIHKIKFTTNLIKIGASALSTCVNLTSVEFPDSINNSAFGISVLSNCPKLTNVKLPKNLTFLPAQLFLRDSALVSVAIPESVTAFHNDVFNSCTSLKNFNLPPNTESLAKGVFQGCTSLTEMKLPETVNIIGAQLFYKCTNLKKVQMSNQIKLLNSFTFGDCPNLTEVTHIDSINTLANSAFLNCTSLTSFTVPSEVTAIWNNAFKGCTALAQITMPQNLDSIAKQAFVNCSALTEIKLPSSTRKVMDMAFQGCTALNSIVCRPLTPPALVENAFDSITYANATLYVNNSVKNTYAAADGWKKFIHLTSGIDNTIYDVEIFGDKNCIIAPEDAIIYNLQGRRYGRENLPSGIYLVIYKNRTYKIFVR